MELQESDIVLCTVEKIAGTIVFVRIDETGQQGSIIFSEVAPGRIRNIRDYVVPKKKIVCKVLRKRGDNIDLSLRRVTQKEEKQVKEQYKKERSYKNILKSVLKEKSKEIVEKIQEHHNLSRFIEDAKKDKKELEKITGKENSKKILEIINSQKKKEIILKKIFFLSSKNPNGITQIKNILGKIDNAEIRYISSGEYSIKTSAENIKDADKKLKEIFDLIEKDAKKDHLEFSIKQK